MSDFPYLKIKHYINGAWKEETGVKTEPLYNPSTGEVIGEVPMASSELAKEAIAIADEAYKTWSKLPVAKRMTYIYKIRQGMVTTRKLARAIAYDQAKHISEARGEVQRVIEILESAACVPSTIQGEYLDQVANNISARVIKQSLGVFGGVAPFNFPALVFGWFIPYAIAAGNTFIFKPSTQSPYFMQIMCEIFMETGLPAGVVNVIHGRRDIAESWYDDSRIAGVCLVGSTPTAKKWRKAAQEAQNVPCCSAERKTCFLSWKMRIWTSSLPTTSTPATVPRDNAVLRDPLSRLCRKFMTKFLNA